MAVYSNLQEFTKSTFRLGCLFSFKKNNPPQKKTASKSVSIVDLHEENTWEELEESLSVSKKGWCDLKQSELVESVDGMRIHCRLS